MAFRKQDDTETSTFLVDSFEGVSREFIDIQEISSQGYTLLLRAKRYGRWYALKTLTEDTMRQSAYVQILRKEFEVLMQLQHPGVVQTIGMEEVTGIGPCIVMEYIDGENLQQLMDKGIQLPLSERRRMAAELCDGLRYVHSLGIVHRDLKPENIMVTRNGRRIKIIDFGMADTDQHAILKQPAGTLSYMAPEQAQQAAPDIRNDIYSLGLILQQMQLGAVYTKAIARCQKPIDQRYRNVAELQEDIAERLAWNTRLKMIATTAAIILLTAVAGVLGWRMHNIDAGQQIVQANIDSMRQQLTLQQEANLRDKKTMELQQESQQQTDTKLRLLSDSISRLRGDNQRLNQELRHMELAQQEALAALTRQIARSGVEAHLDTLSLWAYRWPDLSQRVADVNRYAYRYVDALPASFSLQEREQIRTAMLDKWQQWSAGIKTKANSIRAKMPKDPPATFQAYRNKPPVDRL